MKKKLTVANVITTLALFVILLSIFLIIPVSFSASTYITFPITEFSTRWYEDLFTDPEWAMAFKNSMWIAIWTTVCSLILGMMISLGLREIKGRLHNIFYEYYSFFL